jgi:hypothetical protein
MDSSQIMVSKIRVVVRVVKGIGMDGDEGMEWKGMG